MARHSEQPDKANPKVKIIKREVQVQRSVRHVATTSRAAEQHTKDRGGAQAQNPTRK